MRRLALLALVPLAACGALRGVVSPPDAGPEDAGCPSWKCPQPTPQAAAFPGAETLYLSDDIGRCQDALQQEGVTAPADVHLKWYRQVDGGYLAGSNRAYEYATLSTARLYNGGAIVGNHDKVFWVWHTGMAPTAPGTVKLSQGEATDAGAPVEGSAPPAFPAPGLYWLTVWAYDADMTLAAASESRPFCVGVSTAGPQPSSAIDDACMSFPAPDGGCPEPPTSDHPDKP